MRCVRLNVYAGDGGVRFEIMVKVGASSFHVNRQVIKPSSCLVVLVSRKTMKPSESISIVNLRVDGIDM